MNKELSRVWRRSFPIFRVADSDTWRVLIRGRLSRDSDLEVIWDLFITFPNDYPFSEPVYRFRAPPPLGNVSVLGRVKRNDLYHPAERVVDVIGTLENDLARRDSFTGDIQWTAKQFEEACGRAGISRRPWRNMQEFQLRCNAPKRPLPDMGRIDSEPRYSPLTWKREN
jgi:hypothetical protein